MIFAQPLWYKCSHTSNLQNAEQPANSPVLGVFFTSFCFHAISR